MLRPILRGLSLTLYLVLSPCLPTEAHSPPWSLAPGDNTLTASAAGIHIDQKVPQDTARYALATRPLSLPAGKPWRVAFEVRFGELRTAGSSVRLLHGKETVGWVGADGTYKGTTAFVGTTQQLPGQPADTAWHRFEFDGDGQTLTVSEDGRRIGAGPMPLTPDTLQVGNTQGITAANRQTEVWVRGLDTGAARVGSPGATAVVVPTGEAMAPLGLNWDQTLNGGVVTSGQGFLSLHGVGKGYPVLQTRDNPFPASGEWTASFGYRYSSTGNYGTELRCERADGSGAALVHQDMNGQFLALDGRAVWHVPANQSWHLVCLVSHAGRISAAVDGKPVGDTAAGQPLTRVKLGGGLMPSPWDWNDIELVRAQISPGPPPVAAAPESSPAPSPAPHRITVRPEDRLVECLPGDTLLLSGHYAAKLALQTRTFGVDDRIAESRRVDSAEDDYSLEWPATQVGGQHLLTVRYVLSDDHQAQARRVTVTVLPAAPLTVTGLPASPVADADIAFTASGASFRPARVEVRFNGQTLQTDPAHSFRTTLPLGGLPKGRYALGFDAWDDQGGHYSSDTQYVEVPERLRAVVPSSLTLETKDSRPDVGAQLAPGVDPPFVVYQVGGRTVGAAAEAPYSAGLALSDLKSGNYTVRAVAIGPDGRPVESAPVSVHLVNSPDDAVEAEAERLGQAARAKADARADAAQKSAEANSRVAREQQANIDAGFVPRAGMDAAVFRQQLASRAYHEPDGGSGEVGAVNGLSVLTLDGRSRAGMLFGVDASVRAGTGQTNFLAFSEEDSRVAAQQAAECCKRMTGQMGYRWDWSKYDLTVGYRKNDVKHSGPSAGAADAVAIMSAVFNRPVDSTVAMTGAISLQGDVLPVGGVDFKAEAALSAPGIRTLLVPAGADSMGDITELFILEPGLFVGKQVILVRTLGDALRYALVGWDTSGSVLRSQKILQRGIALFGEGKDTAAMQSFTLAGRLAPENTSVDYWMTMVKAVQKAEKPQ